MSLTIPAVISAAQETPPPSPTPTPTIPPPPPVRREVRGVWIATVGNLDWPSSKDLTTEQQKAELVDLLDRAKALNLNMVLFQVRPAGDALYQSDLEPWSEYLTGTMGKAPQPFYDPLAFAVEEAHKRGLELHAWFNPYRARMEGAKSVVAPNHISQTHPEVVKKYGPYQWMDPGETVVQERTTRVILDVVRRYDIDGVHFDDYFYPYQERDAQDKLIPFPDDASWGRYKVGGGQLSLADWRRNNVNTLVSQLGGEIKALKPWVKFGISPFGIWRPGNPPQIKGLDSYEEIFTDSRKWLAEGWVDYLMPQLYWKIETPAQSFPVLLNWWMSQNPQGRHIWPGLYTSRAVSGENRWPTEEIEYQIRTARGMSPSPGTVHFNAKSLLRKDEQGLTKRLAEGVYRDQALPPTSPWIAATPPAPPTAVAVSPEGVLSWQAGSSVPVWLWVLQYRIGKDWKTVIVTREQRKFALPVKVDEVEVSAVDRLSNQSALVKATLPIVTVNAGQ